MQSFITDTQFEQKQQDTQFFGTRVFEVHDVGIFVICDGWYLSEELLFVPESDWSDSKHFSRWNRIIDCRFKDIEVCEHGGWFAENSYEWELRYLSEYYHAS